MEHYDPVIKVEVTALIDGAHPGVVVSLGSIELDKVVQNLLAMKAGKIDHFHLQHPEFRPGFQGVNGEVTFVRKDRPVTTH